LLFLLLRLAPPAAMPPFLRSSPTSVTLIEAAEVSPTSSRQPQAKRAATREAAEAARPAKGAGSPSSPAPPPLIPETSQPSIWSQVVPLSRQEMAASDLGRFPSRSAEAASGAGAAGAPGDTAEVGTAPNGERLYQAEWYRRPRSAELSTYLPAGAPRVGWGLVACQTVPDYRVDNCQEIGQSPAGSGLARAVRQAAWQFRVRPPRIGGKPLIGAWVRIRIQYGEAAEE
jgi:protein TonB